MRMVASQLLSDLIAAIMCIPKPRGSFQTRSEEGASTCGALRRRRRRALFRALACIKTGFQ